jgi:hypothetical protein
VEIQTSTLIWFVLCNSSTIFFGGSVRQNQNWPFDPHPPPADKFDHNVIQDAQI